METTQILNLAHQTGQRLHEKSLTFSAAESCTGGLLLSTLTDVPGSSAYVMGGVVSYSNDAKMQLLQVQDSTLIAYGAVSEECAREMVIGAQRLFRTDIAISVTGIAGPGGGTAEKPVGLVYTGIKVGDNDAEVVKSIWEGDRSGNKWHSVANALQMILDALSVSD
ncbi:MAG: CinA family protein [Aggregatilineales bacterium]